MHELGIMHRLNALNQVIPILTSWLMLIGLILDYTCAVVLHLLKFFVTARKRMR